MSKYKTYKKNFNIGKLTETSGHKMHLQPWIYEKGKTAVEQHLRTGSMREYGYVPTGAYTA
jgi:hypothetical protein